MRALEPICFRSDDRPDAYRNRRRLRAALRSFIPTVEELPDEPES